MRIVIAEGGPVKQGMQVYVGLMATVFVQLQSNHACPCAKAACSDSLKASTCASISRLEHHCFHRFYACSITFISHGAVGPLNPHAATLYSLPCILCSLTIFPTPLPSSFKRQLLQTSSKGPWATFCFGVKRRGN